MVWSNYNAVQTQTILNIASCIEKCSRYITNEDKLWGVYMKTSSYGNIFFVTGPLWGESTGHWWIPLTKASDAELWCFFCFFYLGLNKQLSKQSRWQWFEMPPHSLWHHCNVPDSKVHVANMGPTWVLSAPDRIHVGSMNLAIRRVFSIV